MAMSEEEILREAARIQASRRKRVAKKCKRCGADFIGIAQAKYCSDACRMAAAREQFPQTEDEAEQNIERIESPLPGESIRDYYLRTARGPLSRQEEQTIDALERIRAIWNNVERTPEDSMEIVNREREARIRQLTSQ
jgi:hypothetical protein